jgi:serine/threonine-protein kinase
VYLDAYWIDQTEVTNAMFAEFLNEMGNQREGKYTWLDSDDEENEERIDWEGGEWRPKSGYGDHPVIEVTWYGARAYCEWAGRRLPTEAQWEKAARGTDGRTYPWGDEFNGKLLNYCDTKCPEEWPDDEYNDGYAKTAPVGSYPDGASPYGALDMAGNVYEFVMDWYSNNYYSNSPDKDPHGPSNGTYKIHRGGSWWNPPYHIRSADRGYTSAYDSDGNVGFRCVLSP